MIKIIWFLKYINVSWPKSYRCLDIGKKKHHLSIPMSNLNLIFIPRKYLCYIIKIRFLSILILKNKINYKIILNYIFYWYKVILLSIEFSLFLSIKPYTWYKLHKNNYQHSKLWKIALLFCHMYHGHYLIRCVEKRKKERKKTLYICFFYLSAKAQMYSNSYCFYLI